MYTKIRSVVTMAAAAALLLPIFASHALAEPTTQPASTQPILQGRDTPAGAMTIYEDAIIRGDIATVADSFNGPAALHLAFAQEIVAEARFANAMNARFGPNATVAVCKECGIHLERTDMKYTNDLWTISPKQPDWASGNWKPDQPQASTQFMQRGPDGIWRIGRLATGRSRRVRGVTTTRAAVPRGPTTTFVNPSLVQAASMTARLERVTPGIEAGKYATPDDVSRALYPEGTPMARMREADQQQKQAKELARKKQNDQLLAAHFDPSTLGGAIGAYRQAFAKRDSAAVANFYLVKDSPDNQFAVATANRALAATDFQRAISEHVDENSTGLAGTFGFLDGAALLVLSPWLQVQEHGDTAVSTQAGQDTPATWFRKVGGVWKQEISPPTSRTIADSIEDMKQDTAAITRITAEIDHGKYKTRDEVQDALGNAMLNSFSDSTFTITMAAPSSTAPPKQHEIPEPKGSQPANRTTPAGAMNRFIRAIENGDATIAADSLYLPNDKNGVAAAAMAHDYIEGIYYLKAVQAKFPGFDADILCYGSDVIGPVSLRDYTVDEWTAPPQYPDVAISSNVYVGKASIENGRKSVYMQHGWTPIMHRRADGIWQLGPWYPQSARQLAVQSKMLAAKDQLLAQAVADLNANKTASIDDLANTLYPGLAQIGAQPVATRAQ